MDKSAKVTFRKLAESVKLFLGITIWVGKQPWAVRCKVFDESGTMLRDVFKVDRWTNTIWYYERNKDGKLQLDEKGNLPYTSRKCIFRIENIPPIWKRVW